MRGALCTIALALFLLWSVTCASAEGTLEHGYFFSDSMAAERGFTVYLPEGYDPEGIQRYQVIYWLHGAGGTEHSWNIEIKTVMDSLIGNGIIHPTVVVKPDGRSGPFNEWSWYTSSELYGPLEAYIVFELTEHIDDNYRTLPVCSHRGISGHSMGGFATLKLALKYHGIYRGTAGMSANPAIMEPFVECCTPFVLDENSGPPYDYDPDAGLFTLLLFSQAGAFSPNMANPPHYVDFPLDEWGETVDSVMARWEYHDPCYLASQLPSDNDLGIYFDCGTDDFPCFYEANKSFAAHLDELGRDYVFWTYLGGHTALFEERVARCAVFLDSLFQAPSSMNDEPGIHSPPTSLITCAPNPCFGSTVLRFRLSEEDKVEAAIFDAAGRLVHRLEDKRFSPGFHIVGWQGLDGSGRSAPAGVYLLRVTSQQGLVGQGRIVVVR